MIMCIFNFFNNLVSIATKISTSSCTMFLPRFQADPTEVKLTLRSVTHIHIAHWRKNTVQNNTVGAIFDQKTMITITSKCLNAFCNSTSISYTLFIARILFHSAQNHVSFILASSDFLELTKQQVCYNPCRKLKCTNLWTLHMIAAFIFLNRWFTVRASLGIRNKP